MQKSTVRVHIPDDLTFSIISKLPIKSLKRFTCVRKSWSLLFENPNFMIMYRNNFISNNNNNNNNHSSYEDASSFILQQTLTYFPYRPMLHLLSGHRFENKVKLDWPPPFQDDDQAVFILGNVINGIVCLYQGRTPVVVLWNPATEEFKVLPPSVTQSPVPYEVVYNHNHGFGYDHTSDDYKVIRYVTYCLDPYDDDNMEVKVDTLSRDDMWEIYSLRSNSWRKLDLDMPRAIYSFVGIHVYMNGVCHWYDQNENVAHLVSFDLSDEVFYTTPLPLNIPMPSDMNDSIDFVYVFRHLMVLNESICLISNYYQTNTFYISILGELGVKESWTVLFILGPLPYIEHPIGAGNNGDLFFRRKDGELVWFNLSTQITKELGITGERRCCQVVIYKESLLPVGEKND